jgi:tRNA(Ile)-lysidine synthase
MFKLLNKIPREVTVAVSGGVDSMAAIDFLSQNHKVSCAHFNHGTKHADEAQDFVADFCSSRNIHLHLGFITREKYVSESLEEYWRNQRYKFLESVDGTVVTAHHLGDAVETYVFSALHGKPKVIPSRRNNIIRPFLLTPKEEFYSWCSRKNIEWIDDPSNFDNKFMRNFIRNKLMPNVLEINPGIHNVVKNIINNQRELNEHDVHDVMRNIEDYYYD